MKVYLTVKYERVIVDSVPTVDINENLHITLKLEMLKVKDEGRNGK